MHVVLYLSLGMAPSSFKFHINRNQLPLSTATSIIPPSPFRATHATPVHPQSQSPCGIHRKVNAESIGVYSTRVVLFEFRWTAILHPFECVRLALSLFSLHRLLSPQGPCMRCCGVLVGNQTETTLPQSINEIDLIFHTFRVHCIYFAANRISSRIVLTYALKLVHVRHLLWPTQAILVREYMVNGQRMTHSPVVQLNVAAY